MAIVPLVIVLHFQQLFLYWVILRQSFLNIITDMELTTGLCVCVTLRVVLRGDRDDNAVLCTKDTTFELKVAETSNTLLLTPSLSEPNTAGV